MRSPPATRGRILAAAARVFARDGLGGATTREIAREAGVNEVTLFRHFKNKEGLLAAVVGQNFGKHGADTLTALPAYTDDLAVDLTAFAQYYHALLTSNLQLVRSMVGEIHHYVSHEREVLAAIFRPARAFLVGRLEIERAAGGLGIDAQPQLLADIFTSMIFTGVLRCSSPHFKRNYTPPAYLKGVVEFAMRALAR